MRMRIRSLACSYDQKWQTLTAAVVNLATSNFPPREINFSQRNIIKSSKSEKMVTVSTSSTSRKAAKSSEGKDVRDQDGDAGSQPVISKTFLKDMIKEILIESKVFPPETNRCTYKAHVSRYSGPEEAHSDDDRYLGPSDAQSAGDFETSAAEEVGSKQ